MVCKACGKALENPGGFCPFCGAALETQAPEAAVNDANNAPAPAEAAQEAPAYTQPAENLYGFYPAQAAGAPMATPSAKKNKNKLFGILAAAAVALIAIIVVVIIALAAKPNNSQSYSGASGYGSNAGAANEGAGYAKGDSASLFSQMEGTWVALFSRKYVSETVQPKYYKTVNFKIESSGRIAFILSQFDLNMKGDSLSASSITDEGDGVYSIKGTSLPFYILYNTKLDEMVFYISYEGDVYFMEMHRGDD